MKVERVLRDVLLMKEVWNEIGEEQMSCLYRLYLMPNLGSEYSAWASTVFSLVHEIRVAGGYGEIIHSGWRCSD